MVATNNGTPVIDRDVSLKRLGGNEQLLTSLIGFFLEDAPILMKHLDDALQAGDSPKVAYRVHSLKGLAATFEALPFQRLAAEIEVMANDGNLNLLVESIPKLKAEYDRLSAELQALVH